MKKQELWTQVYIETIKAGQSTVKAESAATQAVEKRFGKQTELSDIFDSGVIKKIKEIVNELEKNKGC